MAESACKAQGNLSKCKYVVKDNGIFLAGEGDIVPSGRDDTSVIFPFYSPGYGGINVDGLADG